MTFITKNWVALIAIVIAIAACFMPVSVRPDPTPGAVGTRYPDGLAVASTSPTRYHTLIGNVGTQMTHVIASTCYFAPPAATITASTTIAIDCQGTPGVGAIAGESALTGIAPTDIVSVTLSTTTAQLSAVLGRGLELDGCNASSTVGYISCRLRNATGGTFTWPLTGVASGTATFISIGL